ncbi:MAG: TIGR04282 family arsenosugar biosynthesis glycosyltransferase [Gemmatimonadota bacterium]|nr:TIGR04282 family arsenosugar biosynthesis glycosyltransferase [Gemmatimonadota bacterium]
MSTCLIIFARNPEPGSVKTRLHTRYTPNQAAAIYRAFILDTVQAAKEATVDRHCVACDPPGSEAELSDLVGPGWILFPQARADLGERMYQAARHCFDLGAGRVVIIGTDVPSLPPCHVNRAFELLQGHDIVLGPSTDGGYYLVGLARPQREIFQDIAWSTERVFDQTLERARSLGLTVGLLPSWYDVDTPAQLDHLVEDTRAHLQAGMTDPIPHTRACLSTLDRHV